MKPKCEIVYGTDLIIRDPAELATLAVFYDRVCLPFANKSSRTHNISITETDYGGPSRWYHQPKNVLLDPMEWSAEHRLLFEQGVFAGLPRTKLRESAVQTLEVGSVGTLFDIAEIELRFNEGGNPPLRLVKSDLVEHLLRTDIQKPQIFGCLCSKSARQILVSLEARETFHYLMPKLAELSDEQILALREKTKDTREGFSMHLLLDTSHSSSQFLHKSSPGRMDSDLMVSIASSMRPSRRPISSAVGRGTATAQSPRGRAGAKNGLNPK